MATPTPVASRPHELEVHFAVAMREEGLARLQNVAGSRAFDFDEESLPSDGEDSEDGSSSEYGFRASSPVAYPQLPAERLAFRLDFEGNLLQKVTYTSSLAQDVVSLNLDQVFFVHDQSRPPSRNQMFLGIKVENLTDEQRLDFFELVQSKNFIPSVTTERDLNRKYRTVRTLTLTRPSV